jgi:predicted Zn-dependent protease
VTKSRSKLDEVIGLVDSDPTAAERALTAALDDEPEDFELRLLRAIVRDNLKRPKDALVDLEVAVRQRPKDESVLTMLAIDLQAVGDERAAMQAWEQLGTLAPSNKAAWLRVALLAEKLGDQVTAARAKSTLAKL